MRSFAVIWIIAIWHFSNYFDSNSSFGQIVNNGVLSRITFIMLSLFMFMTGLFTNVESLKEKGDIKEYYLKKIKRFYPLYVVASITLYITTIPSSVAFYSSPQQLLLSLFGLASFLGQAPSTLWFMDMLLFFIIITPLLLIGKFNKTRIVVMTCVYLTIYLLSRKTNIVDSRFVRYMPFYLGGLLLAPTKFLNYTNRYGFHAIVVLALLLILPFQHILLDMLKYALAIFGGAKLIISFCKGGINLKIEKVISYISFASMCAYFFHRQIYALEIMLKIPLLVCPLVVFFIAYWIQKLYNRFV